MAGRFFCRTCKGVILKMIHEFAVDPVAISSWDNFRYLIDQCGVEYGRLISRFPGNWNKMVHDACKDNYDCGKISTMQLHSIVERLRNINHRLVRLNRRYNSEKEWLENAEEQHSIKEFRAIISISNPNGRPYVLNASEIDATNPLWNVPREKVIQRKSEGLAACAKMLLCTGKEILFVDPHFNPKLRRFTDTFSYFINYAFENKMPQRLELHVEHTYKSDPYDEWNADCERNLSQIVPKGYSLKIIRWDEKYGGDKPHPRYVLTEIGGIRYDYGLDEWDGVGEGKTTDVSILDPLVYEQRWKDYHSETTNFDLVDEIILEGNSSFFD